MNTTTILTRLIDSGALLGDATLTGCDCDAVLTSRDESVFDQRWMELFNHLKRFEFTPAQLMEIDKLRARAFESTFSRCLNPALAGYVSDDFEIIAKGILVATEDSF